jgi:alkylated DNA repair dioxygenase AlkB
LGQAPVAAKEQNVLRLPEGCRLVRNFLTTEERSALIWRVLHEDRNRFVEPIMSEPGLLEPVRRIPVFSYGEWWNPLEGRYDPPRMQIPIELRAVGSRAFTMHWGAQVRIDSIVVNWYKESESSLILHQDDLEDQHVRDVGSPVLSISIGRKCRFLLGGFARDDDTTEFEISDGDAFLFGGPSRMRFHGVAGLVGVPADAAFPGRISVTFRQVVA